MKQTINSWDEFQKRGLSIYGRRVGNTTRMIDLIIQLLFDGNIVCVCDPCYSDLCDPDERCGIDTFDKLLRRLFREHPAQMKDHVKYDKDKLTIEFI